MPLNDSPSVDTYGSMHIDDGFAQGPDTSDSEAALGSFIRELRHVAPLNLFLATADSSQSQSRTFHKTHSPGHQDAMGAGTLQSPDSASGQAVKTVSLSELALEVKRLSQLNSE